MAHRPEASNSEFPTEAPSPGHPCEIVMTNRAEVEQEVSSRRVIQQMSAASDRVEAEIQRRVALAMAETQAVPDRPTPAAQHRESPTGISPTRVPWTPMPVFSGLSQPGSFASPGQIDPSWEMANRPIPTAGQLTRQTTQSVPPQPVTPPFCLQPATPTLLRWREEYLPEFSVDAVETTEVVLPSNVESLHHWGFALVGFGMHKGSRYREIYHGDPSYIRWVCARSKNARPAQLDFINFSRAMNVLASTPHQPAPALTLASASRAAPGDPQQF